MYSIFRRVRFELRRRRTFVGLASHVPDIGIGLIGDVGQTMKLFTQQPETSADNVPTPYGAIRSNMEFTQK